VRAVVGVYGEGEHLIRPEPGIDDKYDFVNDIDGYRNIVKFLSETSGRPTSYGPYSPLYHITDEEKAMYNYLYATEGKEAAEEYLKYIEEGLNYRQGKAEADIVGDSLLKAAGYGIRTGAERFGTGIAGMFEDEAKAPAASEYGAQFVRENLADTGLKLPEWMGGASIGQTVFDLSNTAGNLAPSLLLSVLTAGAGAPTAVAGGVSSASMGLSAGGNAKAQALRDGYTPEQATRYGVLIGASEGALQYLLGGIGKLGGKLTGGVAKKAIQNIDSSLLRIAATGAIKMAGEGTEEYLQEILDPIYRNLLFNENNQIDLTDPEAVYSFLLGALTAGVMDGSEIIREGIAARPSSLPNVNGAIAAADAAQNIQSKQTAMQNAAQETEQYVYTDETTGVPMVGTRKNIASEVTPEAIARNKKEVAQMAPVAAMDGTEFPKGSTGIFDQVAEFFQTMGNKVANAILGNVTIDRRGIKDSVGHGLGRNKAIAFKAVPQVIRDGRIIDYQKNWKGRGYDTVVLAAPVTIKSEPYYEGVILIRPQDGQRFYLHEVLAANEKDMPTPFKTGTTQGGTSGGTGMPSLISLLDEIRKVNAPENNIDLIPMEEALLGPAPRGILQQEQGLSKNSISQTAEKGNTAGGIYDLDNAVSEAAQIRPVEGVASNVGDIPTDTAKTAQTSVATSDSEVPGALKAVAPQEAAEKLSHSLLRGSESVISEVYADEDGAVSVRIGDRPITMDAREAQAMAAYYDGSVDAVDYVTGFHSVYGLAAQGSTLQQIKGGSSFFGAELTQEQLAGAYNAGHNVYAARQQAATANAAHNAELHARADAERTELELARKRAEALDPASQSFQPGVNRITDGKLSRKQRAQLRVLDAIGKKYGVEIVVDDGLYYDENGEMINSSDANAMFNRETGRIHINLNAVGEAYLAVGMHELVHYVQEYNAEGYSTLETVVLGALEERGEDVNALIRYQMEQFGYSEQLAREEVVANTLPAILNDEAYVKKLVSMDRTLAERIRDFIADFVSFVNETLRTLEGGASWKQMRSIREDTEMLSAIGELFDVALEGVPARRGEASTGGERFSIKYDVNNRPFVVVDEDILKTVPQTKWIDTVKQTLARRFPNGVRVGSDTIKINSQTRREFTYSEYTKWLGRNDKSAYADKFRASSNVDEIILASHGYINEGLKHARKDNIKDFARGGVLLRIGTTDYSADVIVGTTANGDMLLYDIVNLQRTNIQQKRSRHIVQSPLVGNRRSDISAIDNIPQSGTSVNPSIRNSAPENSGEGELFDAAPEGTSGKRNTSVANAKYSVNPAFQAQYDAWDGKNANTRFFVGKTSQTLRYVGVKNQEIVWDASKIIKVKQDHPAMSDEIIKRVPSVIENPIIVMESKTVPGRITMFGELADADGAPVLVALELEPTKDYRLNMEVIKIASAYGKDTSPQKLLDESLVLFVDPNKNRTQTWLKLYKLQLPSSAKYGLNGRVTYKNNSVNPSIRENVQKNAKDGGGARFSIRDNMTEAERYEELKNAELSVATYDVDASKLTRAEVARLENATRRDARQYVKTLYEKFGINDKRYENPSAKIEFAFSGRGIDKSIHEENERGARFADFGKMLASFDEIVENAIPIEIHPDKYAGTRRADPLLERTYVLVSGYEDGGVVPVQFEIKEYREQENQLYVAITLNKIETGIPVTAQRFQQNTGVLSVSPPASTISLRDLFANINPADGEFLKYVPDGFLNAEQRYAKQEALKKEQRKISNLRFSAKDERSVSIKQQIAAHQDELNKISPAATIESGIRPRKNGKPDRTLIRKGLQAFYGSLKYSVERQGFGKVSFDESALSELVHYIKDDAEFAAAKAAPAVVKRGVFVEHHTEHKGRNSVESFTIAAPVVLNGKRGNEAVVVQRTNRNKPHCVRILMPDGGGFDLDVIAKADQDRSAAATKSGRQQLIESASFNSISEADENSNLRFSLKDTSPVDVNELRAGNEKLRRALDLAEDQVKLTAGHKVKEGYVGTLAKRILKEYNSSFDYDTFKANLIKVFEYLSHAKKPNMAEVEEMTIGLMKRVIEKSNTFDAAGYEAYAGVRSYLRETGVSLSEDQKLEAAVLSDTYGAYRASLFGSVKLTNAGIALDSAWQELSQMNPTLFPPDTNASDMPRALLLAAKSIGKENFYKNEFAYDLDSFAADAWSYVFEAYFKSQTFADKKQAQIQELNKQMRLLRAASRKEAQAVEREIIRNATAHAREIAKHDKREAALRDAVLVERVRKRVRPNGACSRRLRSRLSM